MTARTRQQLSEEIAAPLSRLGEAIVAGRVSASVAEAALAAISQLPPEAVSWADRPIARSLGIDWQHGYGRPSLLGLFGPDHAAFTMLDAHKGLAVLFLFHHSGHVRQRALETLRTPPQTPFLLTALMLRMNDWVRQVRVAARFSAERLLPQTSPEVVAAAAPYLLDRWSKWGRWEAEGIAVLDAALQRPDVVAALVQRFRSKAPGSLATPLRHALRGPSLDPYLYELAHKAAHPSVRVVALRALINNRTTWPAGLRREWVDKTYGLSRLAVVLESRAVAHDYPTAPLIRAALKDRSAAVRRVAADAVIEQRALLPDVDDLVDAMTVDPTPAIRDRGDFLRRKLVEERNLQIERRHE
jgi:hypothetical protein